jgi:LmbE family N-acetylglucosaminyl deacetylase
MQTLEELTNGRKPLRVLCIGAHCDDIEIGCGGTLMRLAAERPLDVTWVVLCSTPHRAAEARASASRFLRAARAREVRLGTLRDAYLPGQWSQAKDIMESLKALPDPDIVFTHERDDRHQDHRIACELTWNTFRDHTILEYEVPKFDGGLGQPNFYVPLARAVVRRKAMALASAYPSQRTKGWFDEETFVALARLRGLECNAGLAEAFYARKVVM